LALSKCLHAQALSQNRCLKSVIVGAGTNEAL